MNPEEVNTTRPTSSKKIIYGIIMIILGIVSLIISNYVFKNFLDKFGWLLIAIGAPLILLRLYEKIYESNFFGVFLFMKKENLIAIVKDKNRSKKIITEIFQKWARNHEPDTLKIKGVTLNLVFGNNGILTELIDKKNILNPNTKKIQALLLNPYSMNAITRSIQESRPFEAKNEPVATICGQSLDQHKQCILYGDFECTLKNIMDFIKFSSQNDIHIECKIYSTFSPSFLLVSNSKAITENLIMGNKEKQKTENKLYGILPHLIYGKGEIKDSLENHFDYLWDYDSVPIEDFNEKVEEKYYEINRLFLLYPLQKEIWEREWNKKSPLRSFDSPFDLLYQGYKEYYPLHAPTKILDLGCGDGGGGSLEILKENPQAKIDFIDISENAIKLFEKNIENIRQDKNIETNISNISLKASDMLTFINNDCDLFQYSLIHANFSIIYMTKIKATEIYRKIFEILDTGGVFMLSVWTSNYFKMPISTHGREGYRPNHIFSRIPMTEDLRILGCGSDRQGEIRRFYRNFEELVEEFKSADEGKTMDYDSIHHIYYENDAILRVWIKKK